MSLFKTIEQHNLILYQGYTFTVDVLKKGMFLLVNPRGRIIRNESLFDLYYYLPEQNKNQNFEEMVVGTSALCSYNNKIVKIDGVDFDLNIFSKFPETKFATYKEYYEKRYKVEFYYPDGQFLVYQIKKDRKTGKTEKIHFPVELLKPTGLTDQ